MMKFCLLYLSKSYMPGDRPPTDLHATCKFHKCHMPLLNTDFVMDFHVNPDTGDLIKYKDGKMQQYIAK